MNKNIFLSITLAITTAILIIAVVIYVFLKSFLSTPIVNNKPVYYILNEGTSASDFVNDLSKKVIISNKSTFFILTEIEQFLGRLKPGEYLFPVKSTPKNILGKIFRHDVIIHKFTIVDGNTFEKIIEKLNTSPFLNHTITELSTEEIAKKIGITNITNPEGLLLPATYSYKLGTDDIKILQSAYNDMQIYLNKAWEKKSKSFKFEKPYTALIIASMVQKESAIQSERAVIAGIIINRLKQWIQLQIDPTIIYALGKSYTGKLTHDDLKIDSKYNTYKHYGLPPTPICMPGEKAIEATLHPVDTDSLYFVAKGDGTHAFSSTLAKQQEKIDSYLKHKD